MSEDTAVFLGPLPASVHSVYAKTPGTYSLRHEQEEDASRSSSAQSAVRCRRSLDEISISSLYMLFSNLVWHPFSPPASRVPFPVAR